MAVASAGPYASLHLAPDRQPLQHPTTQFFTGRMPFLLPNQQHQSTESQPFRILCSKIILKSPFYRSYSRNYRGAAMMCGGFAAECPAGGRYQPTASGATYQHPADTDLCSKCGQHHVDGQSRRLNTDMLLIIKR